MDIDSDEWYDYEDDMNNNDYFNINESPPTDQEDDPESGRFLYNLSPEITND